MLENNYIKQIVLIAKDRLEQTKRPLSDKELCRNIVSILKKKLGKEDRRHSSKVRFSKEILPFVLNHPTWQNAIAKTEHKKFDLVIRIQNHQATDNKFELNGHLTLDKAITELNTMLKKVDPLKLEELVRLLIEKKFGYDATLTSRSNDGGIDIIATKKDETAYSGKSKKMFIFAQVKRYDKTVGREYGDKFIGAVQKFRIKKDWSKFDCFFITTSTLPPSFEKNFRDSEPEGVTFSCWDGRKLSRYLIESGIGVNFHLDTEFWEKQQ
ncbi:restriction endonuclease [Terrimonas pollutisoli]|uniref:restriction endonuclease n=1 Tax=Terrimonas pollutisoli TaxID=3034147 RepID=UPI0023EA82E8|nr:restriction endonuclease [Terrimonas sp. H1YJ31]